MKIAIAKAPLRDLRTVYLYRVSSRGASYITYQISLTITQQGHITNMDFIMDFNISRTCAVCKTVWFILGFILPN